MLSEEEESFENLVSKIKDMEGKMKSVSEEFRNISLELSGENYEGDSVSFEFKCEISNTAATLHYAGFFFIDSCGYVIMSPKDTSDRMPITFLIKILLNS